MMTEPIPMRQFRTYIAPHASANEYRDAEVGPSTWVPRPTPYVGPPTLQPSGGMHETTVDAEHQTSAEENGVPVGHSYSLQIFHVTEGVLGTRQKGGLVFPTARDNLAGVSSGDRSILRSCAIWLNAIRVPIKCRP